MLGVRWNFVQDEFIFDLNELAFVVKKTLPTKRQIIAITTKCYDPFVFISPVVICGQEKLLSQWKSLVPTFQGVSTAIPRCYFTLSQRSLSQCTLQGFCDASVAAYVAVVYLKIEVESGSAISLLLPRPELLQLLNKQTKHWLYTGTALSYVIMLVTTYLLLHLYLERMSVHQQQALLQMVLLATLVQWLIKLSHLGPLVGQYAAAAPC